MLIQIAESVKKVNKRTLKFLLSVPLIFMLTACSSHPVVETVTTDAGRESALPANAKPVVKDPNLPARDPDIEATGDHIAEAITILNTRSRDRRDRALRALNQAETTLNHALRNGNHAESVRTALHTTLKDLDFAEHAVQRSSPDAVKQLATINKNLDGLNEQ